MTLREEALRDFGVMGRGGDSVPVEVGLAKGQPDRQQRAGAWDTYPGGEVGFCYNLPVSKHYSFEDTAHRCLIM